MPLKATFHFTEWMGARLMGGVGSLGEFSGFTLKTLAACARPSWRVRLILEHAVHLGVRAMPLAMTTAVFVGMVIVLQTGSELAAFNAKQYAAGGAAKALTRIMIPIFTALVVGARTAASIAAELGTMRVTEQIDAMEVLDVDPRRYLIVPRVIATTLMLPLVTLYGDLVGLLGGMFIGWAVLGVSTQLYINITLQWLEISDVIIGLVTSVFFGATMGLCGCYFGFRARGGAAGVGVAVTLAVVSTLLLVILEEYILSSWSLYLLEVLQAHRIRG